MMKHAIYVGKTIDEPKTGIFLNYGMTGVIEDTNDGAKKIFGADGTTAFVLLRSTDLYFSAF